MFGRPKFSSFAISDEVDLSKASNTQFLYHPITEKLRKVKEIEFDFTKWESIYGFEIDFTENYLPVA